MNLLINSKNAICTNCNKKCFVADKYLRYGRKVTTNERCKKCGNELHILNQKIPFSKMMSSDFLKNMKADDDVSLSLGNYIIAKITVSEAGDSKDKLAELISGHEKSGWYGRLPKNGDAAIAEEELSYADIGKRLNQLPASFDLIFLEEKHLLVFEKKLYETKAHYKMEKWGV